MRNGRALRTQISIKLRELPLSVSKLIFLGARRCVDLQTLYRTQHILQTANIGSVKRVLKPRRGIVELIDTGRRCKARCKEQSKKRSSYGRRAHEAELHECRLKMG